MKTSNKASGQKNGGALTRPSVFLFRDYRSYLKALTSPTQQAPSQKYIGLGDLAKKCGVSTGFLSLVIAGKRRPGLDIIHQISDALRLDKAESRALVLLYLIAESENERVRHESFEELSEMIGFRNLRPDEAHVYEYLSNWLHVAIRELLMCENFVADAEWIRERMVQKVSVAEIQKAFDFLVHHKLIAQDPTGKWQQTQKDLRCEDDTYKFSLGRFYQQMLPLASNAIEHVSKDHRHLASYTLALSRAHFEKIREILEASIDQIQQVESDHSKGPTDVYHVSLFAFPFTKSAASISSKVEEKEVES